MMLVAVVFSFGVAWIAHRGVAGSTNVSIAINVIQITALLIFAVMAFSYRAGPSGRDAGLAVRFDVGRRLHLRIRRRSKGRLTASHGPMCVDRDKDGVPKPKLDAAGKPVPFLVAYPEKDDKGVFLSHPNAASVVGIHNWGFAFVQATVAILILVGFESVTAMGGEAKNAKRDVPDRGDHFIAGSGGVLLSDRVLRGELLPQQRVPDDDGIGIVGADRRHDDHHRQRLLRSRAAAASSCWWKRSRLFWP